MKKQFLFILLYVICGFSAKSQWTQTNGPYGGEIKCFATLGGSTFAGTHDGGVFKTTNNGTNWIAVNNGLSNPYIRSMTSDGSNVYVGAEQGQLFATNNNGISWTNLSSNITFSEIKAIAINGSTIYTGSLSDGVIISYNNGLNWSQSNNGITNFNINTLKLNGSTIIAGTEGGGIFSSTNNGVSWVDISSNITNLNVRSIEIIGSLIFAGTDGGGVFISSNNGGSWAAANTGITNYNIKSLLVNGSDIMAATGDGIFLSTNNGASWTTINNGLPTPSAVQSLIFNGITIFAGTFRGGVFSSSNNGLNWTEVNNGITAQSVASIAIKQNNIYVGTWGGMYLSTNNGLSFLPANNGLSYSIISAVAISGNNVIAGTNGGGIFLSTNNGVSWSNSSSSSPFINALTVRGDTIIAGTGNGIIVSIDKGLTWNASGLANVNVFSILLNGTNYWAGTNAGVFLSSDGGINWMNVSSNLPNLYAFHLAALGNNIYVGTWGSGIFLTTNLGISWNSVNVGLVNGNISSLIGKDSVLIAGTLGSQIFASTDYGANWTDISIPTQLTFTGYTRGLTINGSTIYVGFEGFYDGVWKRSIPELICSMNLPVLATTGNSQICSGDTLNISLSCNIPSNFLWQATPNLAVTGLHISAQTSTNINDVLTSNTTQQVTYLITPTSVGGNCIGNTQNIVVTINQLPHVSVVTYPDSCKSNGAATAITNLGTPPYSYSWSNGALNQSISGLLPGTYSVNIQDSNFCSASASGIVRDTTAAPLPICLTSVDSLSEHNIIIWEKPITTYIDSFRIYREDILNIYSYVASIGYHQYSEYVDTSFKADPKTKSMRYKMTILDICGKESAMSNYHNTVLLQDQQNGNFNWNFYEVQNQPSLVSQYILQRYDSTLAKWVSINNVAGSQNAMIAPGYFQHQYSLYRVLADLGSYGCTPSARVESGVNNTRSNIKNRIAIGVKEIAFDKYIKLMPNPAMNSVTVNLSIPIERINIFNTLGKIVSDEKFTSFKTGIMSLDLSQLAPGIYTVVCKGKDFEVRKKLVVE